MSNETLTHQLKKMLEAGAREVVEALPDGIHSGQMKAGAKGIFFYFKAGSGTQAQHFWRYYDLRDRSVIDNRYLIANLIQCDPNTSRFVEPNALVGVFEIQEIVIGEILRTAAEKKAAEVAPRTIDAIQQTVATAIQGYLNHPDVDRKEAIELIRFLNQPMLQVQIKASRAALKNYKSIGQIGQLIEEVRKMKAIVAEPDTPDYGTKRGAQLKREDLRLICFEFLYGA